MSPALCTVSMVTHVLSVVCVRTAWAACGATLCLYV